MFYMNGECVLKYMYMVIKLCSRCIIFVLYLNIYFIAGVQIVKGVLDVFYENETCYSDFMLHFLF